MDVRFTPSFLRALSVALLAVLVTALGSHPAAAQSTVSLDDPTADNAEASGTASEAAPITLTLDRAVRIALGESFELKRTRLDVRNADAQVREAWGQVMPQVDASAGYTRNVVTANPFAGSDVTGLFAGGGATDWVAFNERARTDDDPTTNPITFQEFQERQQDAREAAGISLGGGGNPFGVDNEFRSGITITQTLFNGSAFAAISGAQQLKDVNQRAVDRQTQVLADNVRSAFYNALFAQERVNVLNQRITRTDETLQEVTQQVRQGVTPKFQRLSAEVELSNLETEVVQAQNTADQAIDQLKVAMGLTTERPIQLEGSLRSADPTMFVDVSTQRAVETAMNRRPDIEQARLAIDLREVEKNTVRAEYLPRLSATANFNYTGRVPDNRQLTLSDPNDPFAFSTQDRGFFSDDFWNPSVNVGLQLTWNLFNGFQTTARMEQREVAIRRAEINHQQTQQTVEVEVRRALRDLQTARQRILSQEKNVERAETNYEFAAQRVREGVSSQLELREASDQLDQSRLNYLQALRDYLIAQSAFETAVGLPITESPDNLNLTSR